MNNRQYLGHLRKDDPLYSYLHRDIQPQLAGANGKADYRVFRLHASNDVFLYEEKHSGAKCVGKFFLCGRTKDAHKAAARLTNEFDSLCTLRGWGLKGAPHHVVQPLGINYGLNALLVTENGEGELFSDVLLAAIQSGDKSLLFRKLTALAYFLATFHNRTAEDDAAGVDFQRSCDYMDALSSKLLRIGGISHGEADELHGLREQWRRRKRMWEDRQVIVHGDATPDNFLLGSGLQVTAFDLERSHRDDRVFDVGRLAGELKHFFLRATGDRQAAEPFIGHFLWEYACHFPDRNRAFRSVTGRLPFYMGITLLRIARNSWVSRDYRRCLINEAKACLRSF